MRAFARVRIIDGTLYINPEHVAAVVQYSHEHLPHLLLAGGAEYLVADSLRSLLERLANYTAGEAENGEPYPDAPGGSQ